jgi:Ca-activated chloride channel family protein
MNDHNETRLTDYALGELDESARREVEARLRTDAAARAEVDELTRLSGLLRQGLPAAKSTGDMPTVQAHDAALRAAIAARVEQHAGETSTPVMLPRRSIVVERWPWFVGGAAALLVAALLLPQLEKARETGRVARVESTSEVQGLLAAPTRAPESVEEVTIRLESKIQSAASISPTAPTQGRLESAESFNWNGGVAASPGPVGNVTNGGTLTFSSGDPSKNAAVTKSGAGTLANSGYYDTGAATISGGALAPGHDKVAAATAKPHPVPLGDVAKEKPAVADPHAYRIEREQRQAGAFNTEAYDSIVENPFVRPTDSPLSTFSIDVDTASYSNVRRFLNGGALPPRGAVRIEEFVNYFSYNYPQPKGDDPFSVTTDVVDCPWNAEHVLMRVGLKGKEIHRQERPATNLVFLVDVSGSMQDANKLPLVRESLKLLVRELGDRDRVALVVYAGRTAVVLPSTGADRKQTILEAIDALQSGGSTNGGAGITLAYQLAVDNFIKDGVNRVVLATDGDFNVGVTNQDELVRLIEEKAKSGVFFSALGYGMGNLKDSTLEKLSDKGNGNYAYIDTLAEAKKVLVEQMSGTLVTIAKDVKVQIEFNPAKVVAYRLLGYENRVLAAQDFNDDKKDAGEIGAGHTVTALYELALVGTSVIQVQKLPKVDPLKYQPQPKRTVAADAPIHDELLTLKLRYKAPDGDVSKLIERPVKGQPKPYAKAGVDFKFSAAVAAFGLLLRQSEHRGTATYDAVLEMAQEGIGRDVGGYRKEFVALVRKARDLAQAAPVEKK